MTLYVNETVRRWRGLGPEDLAGRHVAELVGALAYRRSRPFLRAALAGRPQRFEHTLTLPTGALFHSQVDLIPVTRNGVPSGCHMLVVDLSDRVVAEATVEEAITQAALLEERSRIAADMNDQVIQSLYAAGLTAERARSSPARAVDFIDTIATCIDQALAELREAIRKLNRVPRPNSLGAALAPMAHNVSRWLGHDPTVRLEGPIEDLPPAVARDALLALSRMLGEVGTRPGVRDITILLAHRDGLVSVVVSDDGPTPTTPAALPSQHNRGVLDDLHRQAESHAGTFTMQPTDPRGTVMSWQIPTRRER